MMTRSASVWIKLCAVVTLAGGVACSAGGQQAARQSPIDDDAGGADSSAAGRVTSRSPDSLSAAENGSLESDLLDAIGDGTPAAQANEAAAENDAVIERRTAPSAREAGLACEIAAITGYRSDTRARFGGWHGISGGFRTSESMSTGYVGIGGRGALGAFHAGRFTLRAGERLVLGRGIGSYAASGSGAVRGGFSVSPSLSSWTGGSGAALGLEWRGWQCHTAVLSCGGGVWSRPQSVWVSAVKQLPRGTAGVTAGEQLAGANEIAAGAARPRVISCHVSFRGEGFGGSCEVAHIARQVFFAARVSERYLANRWRWAILVFRAPYTSPMGVSGLEPVTKADQGVRLDVTSHRGGVSASTVLIAGRTWSPSRLRTYRRLFVGFEGGRRPMRWETSVQARSDTENAYPTGEIGREITSEMSREVKLRAVVGMGDSPGFDTSVRIEVLPRIDRFASGVLLSMTTGLASDRIEGRIQLSAHSLPAGRRGFASRPGIGPFETLAPLSGKGSDLSMRLRARIWRAARLVVFYGSQGSGAERFYVGAEYRR